MPGTLVKLPIVWNVPEGLPLRYATNIVVQHTREEFVLSFFEIAPPLVVGPDEDRQRQLENLGQVRADCIARLVVSPTRYKEFLGVMNENWAKFRDHTAGGAADQGDNAE
jgi:hypothetical protein